VVFCHTIVREQCAFHSLGAGVMRSISHSQRALHRLLSPAAAQVTARQCVAVSGGANRHHETASSDAPHLFSMLALGSTAAAALGYHKYTKNGLECGDVTTTTTTTTTTMTTTSTSAASAKTAKGPVDTSMLTYRAKHDDNLEADPPNAKYRVALVSCYVDSHPSGGSDKVHSGHRFDTVGIANGLKHAGLAVQILFYNVKEHDKFFEVVQKFDAVVMRINPGQITANKGDQQKFDTDMTAVAKKIPVWPTPANMELMGAKDALTMIKDLDFGLPDTLGYYSPADIKAGFPKTIAFQKRVVKQNRGSSGEGIWIIELKNKNYCAKYGDRLAGMDEMLICKEANDNHIEEHTVGEFIEWCENGRTNKSGKWTSQGTGKYFEGGVEAGGQMVDQRFCPRISEGEARFVMIGRKCFRVEHYVYIGGVGGETKTTIYPVSSPDFPDSAELPLNTIRKKLEAELETYVKALGLSEKDIPLLWAADFIPVDGHKSPMVIGEFNCSCLGLAGFLDARGRDLQDITMRQYLMGQEMADKIGALAAEQLESN